MNKLSKEKRDRLILTIIVVVGTLGVLYTYVYGAQRDRLNTLDLQITGVKAKLASAERLVRSEDFVERNLAENKRLLEERTRDMAPAGQYYYWFLKLLDEFRKEQGLGTGFIVDITQPEFIEVGLLPKFQFKAASFGVRLNGRFHEVGKFIADLENSYPYFRVQDLRMLPGSNLGPAGGSGEAAREKLMVELRVVTLVKPSTT
jgi:hypothetical protein